MKELEKNLEATGGVPAEAELAAINRFAKSPLRAEEVYTFSLRLCDNEVDRDWERFDTAALNTLGDLFVGKSGIFDHQWTAEGQTARIYRTEMVREGAQVTAVGDGYCWLKAWAYLLRTEKNADLGRKYLRELRREVTRLAMLADDSMDGGALAKAAEHLEEPELLELKRVYGAQAARRFPPVPQLRSRGAAKTEDETEFLI